jgi:hypothetical protein
MIKHLLFAFPVDKFSYGTWRGQKQTQQAAQYPADGLFKT